MASLKERLEHLNPDPKHEIVCVLIGARKLMRSDDSMWPTLDALLSPGIVGTYTHVEVTEIIGFREKADGPVNVFTLLVAEDRRSQDLPPYARLNAKQIRIRPLKDWSFSIFRYYRTVEEIFELLGDKAELTTWGLSGEPLKVGPLSEQQVVIVPPDTYLSVSWNKVLKNNFWSGSYVLEWHDPIKKDLQPILAHPPCLQELTAQVRKYVPLGLAAISDRLGNVVLQIPLTALILTASPVQNSGGFSVEVAWHSEAVQRPLRIVSTRTYDGVVAGAAQAQLTGPSIVLPLADGPGEYSTTVWDDSEGLVLAVSGPSAFMSVISVDMNWLDPEPRLFETISSGSTVLQRIGIYRTNPIKIGEPHTASVGDWTQTRIYREEIDHLASQRAFVQYRPQQQNLDAERMRALGDIRYLISMYCKGGVYIWDPYLNAADILDTLFFCPLIGADLRALTSMNVSGSDSNCRNKSEFVAHQQAVFSSLRGNFRGLRLEFRGRFGSRGWAFHDRFLIFPETNEGPLAWSLGTSVNSLGKQHHILQRVGDGQLIADAFLELWDQLTGPENLVWKCP